MDYDSQDSILATIKKMLGIDDDYSVFDMDVIVLINSALMTLQQLDVGPKEGFIINDYTQTWHQFLTNEVNLQAAKMYVYLKVKTSFDPPSSSFVQTSYENQIRELEWRLCSQAESIEEFDFVKQKIPEDNNKPVQQVVNVTIEGENAVIVPTSNQNAQQVVVQQMTEPIVTTPVIQQVTSSPIESISEPEFEPESNPEQQSESESIQPTSEPPKYTIKGENLQLFSNGLGGLFG